MSPEDKEKFAKAYRAWMDKNPDADTPLDPDVTFNDEPLTPRVIMELGLASEELFDSVDKFLANNRQMTLDEFIEMRFGPQPKAEPAPQPPKKPTRPQKHWKI